MKKFISFVLAVIIVICTLAFSAGGATAAGTIAYQESHFVWGKGVVFVFDASGYRNRDVRPASLSVGGQSFDAHCRVNKKAGKIVCIVGSGLTQYAGQFGTLTMAGQAFYVKIPDKGPYPYGSGSISCAEGLVPGADVTFSTAEGSETHFVSGSTIADVRNSAKNWLGSGSSLLSIQGIGGLYCNEAPN